MDAVFDGQRLTGDFQIRITAVNPLSDRIPALYETGGRTEAIAKKWGITDPRTLHRNGKNGPACVCVTQFEKRKFPPGSNLLVFVEELVVPYLFGLVFYEANKRWPWGDYSHGSMGLLEFYADDMTPQTAEDVEEIMPTVRREDNWEEYRKQFRKPRANRPCLCGSKKPFLQCHDRGWKGLLRLNSEIHRLNINVEKLFKRSGN